MKLLRCLILWWTWLPALVVSAQPGIMLQSGQDGLLRWTNSSLCVTCRVEWAAHADGPWQTDWASLSNLVMDSDAVALPVPRFFRIACTPTRPQLVTTITGQATLAMITNRFADPLFIVLDVRTASEYSTRHIQGAVNLNFYSATFATDLSLLNRCHTYIVHCASGGRSGQAVLQMKALGFVEVYDLGAFSNFSNTPGSTPWLEP